MFYYHRTTKRHKEENTKLENKRAHFMRDYNKSRELLLSNPKEVNIMGDLIAMNMSVIISFVFVSVFVFFY